MALSETPFFPPTAGINQFDHYFGGGKGYVCDKHRSKIQLDILSNLSNFNDTTFRESLLTTKTEKGLFGRELKEVTSNSIRAFVNDPVNNKLIKAEFSVFECQSLGTKKVSFF
jgi:hypothetical protein